MSCEHCPCTCVSCSECGPPKETYLAKLQRLSPIALADPQPGDLWNEMLSWWMYVVERDGERVVTMSASGPCTFPIDAKREEWTLAEFRNMLSYKSGTAGTWAMCDSRENDIGWYGPESTRKG